MIAINSVKYANTLQDDEIENNPKGHQIQIEISENYSVRSEINAVFK